MSELRELVKAIFPARARRSVKDWAFEQIRTFRQLTHRSRVLPDFIIAGAQRAGTTSLYRYLVQHPKIAPSIVKEVHYFDLNIRKGLDWYKLHFPSANACKIHDPSQRLITGEASPFYMFHPYAMERIAELLPHVRIIILLRNPADRAFSHYCHQVRAGRERKSFKQAILDELERIRVELDKYAADSEYAGYYYKHFSYLARGIYVDQVRRCLDLFSADRLLIIQSEEFWKKPQDTYDKVLSFLGVNSWALKKARIFNSTNHKAMSSEARQFLLRYYANHNERLYELLGRRYDWGDDVEM